MMSEIETRWSSDDPRRIPLTWRNEHAVLSMAFISDTAFPPPGCTPGEAELLAAVRRQLAEDTTGFGEYATWRDRVAQAEKEMRGVQLQIEGLELERRQAMLDGAAGTARQLGEIATAKATTERIRDHIGQGLRDMQRQAEVARQRVQRSLRLAIDRATTRLMEEAQAAIAAAAQQAAADAGAALTRLAAAHMSLRLFATMGDVHALRMQHLIDEVAAPPNAAPAELPAPPPPRDEAPAPPATATVALPGGNPTTVPLAVQTSQHGIAQVTVTEAPPPAPVVPDAPWANADLAPQPVTDAPPAIEQGPAAPALPSSSNTLFTGAAATKPPRRRQRAE